MKLNIPTFSGLKEASKEMKEVIKWLNDLAQNLSNFSSKGIAVRDNLDHNVFVVRNDSAMPEWITIPHNLKRVPTGYFLQKGGTYSVQDAILGERTAQFLISSYTEVTVVIL